MKQIKQSIAVVGIMFSSLSIGLNSALAHSGGEEHQPSPLPPLISADYVLDSGTIFYGNPLSIGNGFFQSFIKYDDQNKPTDVGVVFTKETLSSLPNPENNVDSTFPFPTKFYYPPLPPEFAVTPFGDLEILYFNDGHEPEDQDGYREEHLDFSFFLPTPEERNLICPNPNVFGECVGEELEAAVEHPPAGAIPTGFVQAPPGSQFYALSRVGSTFFDPLEPYPLNANLFYAFNEGKMTFIDLLITIDLFEEMALQTENTFISPVAQPAGLIYPEEGYYPTTYSIQFDGENQYVVTVGDFVFRSASVPESSSTATLILVGILAIFTRLNLKQLNSKNKRVKKSQ